MRRLCSRDLNTAQHVPGLLALGRYESVITSYWALKVCAKLQHSREIVSCTAGYITLSICNLLLILILGLSDSEPATKQPANSAYSNSPPPHTTPTYPPRG